jgi:hypothetical protein
MMWRPALLIVPLLLASCGESGPKIVAAPLSPQEQACAAQADQDPALRQARAIGAGQLDWEFQHEPEVEQLKRDAITRCLKARGLLSRGGVERAH